MNSIRIMPKRFSFVVYLITTLFFICFFLFPIWEILYGGFTDANGKLTLVYLLEVFKNPVYIEGLQNSFFLAILSTFITLLIALPLAIIADRFEFPMKGMFMSLVLLPIMLPPFVGAIGITKILGEYGALNALLQAIGLQTNPVDWLEEGKFISMAILIALGLYPIMYLNALASLSNIDPAMEEAAQNLGCRGIKRFWKITLPLMRPGLFAGCTIVFIWSFTELGVPLIFDFGRITPVQIFSGLKDIGSSPFPYALVTAMLLFSVLFYVLGKGLFGRENFAMMAKAGHKPEPKHLGLFGKIFCSGFFGVITFLAILPHLAVIIYSFSEEWYKGILPIEWTFRNYKLALGDALTVPSIGNSLIYAGGATLVSVIIGVSVAYVIARTKFPGRGLLDAMIMLPLAVPGMVLAFGYIAMTLEGKTFSFLNPVENPTILLIIAYAIRKMPFIVRAAVAGLQQTSETYEEAAQNLGCQPIKALLIITIPLISANLLAGTILSFAKSMLEVSDSMLLAQKAYHYPITKAIYELLNLIGDGPFLACALGVWAMAFLGVTIIGTSILMGKRLGNIFKV